MFDTDSPENFSDDFRTEILYDNVGYQASAEYKGGDINISFQGLFEDDEVTDPTVVTLEIFDVSVAMADLPQDLQDAISDRIDQVEWERS